MFYNALLGSITNSYDEALEFTERGTVRLKNPNAASGWYPFRGEWWLVVENSEDLKDALIGWMLIGANSSRNVPFYGKTRSLTANRIVTTKISSLNEVLRGTTEAVRHFNQPINQWDVSNVTDFQGMFQNCVDFNQDIGNWDMSAAEIVGSMFQGCTSFNQDISGWNLSSALYFSGMFKHCVSFNKPLDAWALVNPSNLSGLFHGATSFNQPLSSWQVGPGLYMCHEMFRDASSFNQDLSSWDISGAEYKHYFDEGATSWQSNFKPVGA